jgi:hypothetical protein
MHYHHLVLSLCLLLTFDGFAHTADASPRSPTASPATLPAEQFTLADGRTLNGRYDETLQRLYLLGPGNAYLHISPKSIVRRELLTPRTHRAPTVSLPSPRTADQANESSSTAQLAYAQVQYNIDALENKIQNYDRRLRELDRTVTNLKATLIQWRDIYLDAEKRLERLAQKPLGFATTSQTNLINMRVTIQEAQRDLFAADQESAAIIVKRQECSDELDAQRRLLNTLPTQIHTNQGAIILLSPGDFAPTNNNEQIIADLTRRLAQMQAENDALQAEIARLKALVPIAPAPTINPSQTVIAQNNAWE